MSPIGSALTTVRRSRCCWTAGLTAPPTPAALRVTRGTYDTVKKETEITISHLAVADAETWSGFDMAYDSTDPTKTWLGPRYLGQDHEPATPPVKVKGNYQHAEVYGGEAIKFGSIASLGSSWSEHIGGGRAAAHQRRGHGAS